MDAIELLLSRRSIRRYTAESVEKNITIKMIRAGCAAPSAFNQQPWEFIVIQGKNVLNDIARLHPYASMVKYAAGLIVVCANPLKDEKMLGMWPQDCAAATQNILLAAHALGLGAVWIGIYPNKDYVTLFRKICKIPIDIIPFSGISFGVPAVEKPYIDRFDDALVHWNVWRKK